MRTKIQWDTGWKLYAIELLICGQVFQKNTNIRILQENLKKNKELEMWDMYLSIMLHLWTKIRFHLIFSNCFYPKLSLIKQKKKLKNNFHFPFLHCFYSVISTCNCQVFLFSLLSLFFLWQEKKLLWVVSYTKGDKVMLICISLL